jgi:hypothetical protein
VLASVHHSAVAGDIALGHGREEPLQRGTVDLFLLRCGWSADRWDDPSERPFEVSLVLGELRQLPLAATGS